MSRPSLLAPVVLAYQRPLVGGRLLRRYKRFLADVDLDQGGPTTVHCPNSGSMLGAMKTGARVYCSISDNPKRRYRHTWEMCRMGRHWVGINTLLANRLAVAAARGRALDLFAEAAEVRPEVKVGPGTRLDILVQRPGGPLYVEVKNVSLVTETVARFPDAVTTRGAKHLRELMRLKAQGVDAAMVYIVQRGDAEAFGPAAGIDPVYAELYHQARRRGVMVRAVRARVGPTRVRLDEVLPLVD